MKKQSDEQYVLDLCDQVLGSKANRQARFDCLRGDSRDPGRLGVRLPVDAYWPEMNLVVEYRERQHVMAVAHFDKPNILTVSGVHRGEQRRRYDQRRRDVLPAAGMHLVEILYSELAHDSRGRLCRRMTDDIEVLRGKLRFALPSEH
jgi:hypothetical protein